MSRSHARNQADTLVAAQVLTSSTVTQSAERVERVIVGPLYFPKLEACFDVIRESYLVEQMTSGCPMHLFKRLVRNVAWVVEIHGLN